MTDRDIRNAFAHLKEDVMTSLQTEERLEQITKRRTRVRPAFTAFAGAAAVALIVGAAILAFRPDTEPGPVPPATGGPTTTVTDTTVPPLALPDLAAGTVVVADPALAPSGPVGGEVSTLIVDGNTVVVDVDAVVGDGAGGLFVQVDNSIGWLRPDAPNVTLLDPTFVDGAIELRLEDSAVIDGEINVIFIVAGGQEEQRYEEVWRFQVPTATPTVIYHTGAYEGGITRASLQNDVLVVTRHAEGFSWFEFFTAEGRPIDVSNPKPDAAEFPVFVDQGVLSPDGTTLVYLESDSPAPPEDNNWRIDLVVYDLVNGIEDRRMEIEFGNWYADRMDFDGAGIVLGRIQWNGEAWEAGTPLRIESLDADGGIVTELSAVGSPSLVKSD